MKASRLASVLYWAVIPAAFIGPGTVTSAAQAGAVHGFALLWTFAFSTLACVVLQTMAARTASATGLDLGRAIASRFPGTPGRALRAAAAWSIVLGCAAYQAGNLIGAAQGLMIASGGPRLPIVLACTAAAGILLWSGTPAFLARSMGFVVAVMGFMFAWVAMRLGPDVGAMLRGLFVPSLPTGSAGIALALIGTTVVPYNLYLGAGLARGRSLADVKFGVAVAVAVGAAISAAILVAGTAVGGSLSTYAPLTQALSERLGPSAEIFFGCGLFAAGFTSAITAPLAAGIALEGVRGGDPAGAARREKFVRIAVLLVGAAFAASEVKPIPAIIAAQALNGFVLPLAAAFVMVVANDVRLDPAARNGRRDNLLGAFVVFVTTALGASQLAKAAVGAFGTAEPPTWLLMSVGAVAGVALLAWIRRATRSGATASANETGTRA